METKRSLLSSRQVLPALLITVGIFSMELFNPQFAKGTVSSPAFKTHSKIPPKRSRKFIPEKKLRMITVKIALTTAIKVKSWKN